MHERELRRLIVAVTLVAVGCAPKITPQQAAVEDAFSVCRRHGPSTRLERVDPDGKFSVVGRGAEPARVHDCMVRQEQASTTPAVARTPRSRPVLAASRLPGTWRGTLTVPAQAGQPEVASPATVRFAVAGGTLRWTLATGPAPAAVAADGTAVVVDGELRMTGNVRSTAAGSRGTVPVLYAGSLVGDRLEVSGVAADRQLYVLSVRRVGE